MAHAITLCIRPIAMPNPIVVCYTDHQIMLKTMFGFDAEHTYRKEELEIAFRRRLNAALGRPEPVSKHNPSLEGGGGIDYTHTMKWSASRH